MTTYNYKNEIIVAGLLHDIGKFFNDAGGTVIEGISSYEGKSRTHAQTSGDFIRKYSGVFAKAGLDTEAIRQMCEYHQSDGRNYSTSLDMADSKYKNIVAIVSKADGISSSERNKSANARLPRSENALTSIFSRYKFDGLYRIDSTVGPEGTYQFKNNGSNADRHINLTRRKTNITKFCTEFSGLSYTNAEELIKAIDKLLYKYTSLTVSNSNEVACDISLYDHLKTTAAIASVIYSYAGDDTVKSLSGKEYGFKIYKIAFDNVGDFLFDSSCEASIGTLRLKTEYIENVLDSICKHICGLSGCCSVVNTVIKTDSSRYIIVNNRNTSEVMDMVNKKSLEIWSATSGKLIMYANSIELGIDDFADNGIGLQWINELRDKDVHQASVYNLMTNGGVWNPIEIGRSVDFSNTDSDVDTKNKAIILADINKTGDMLDSVFKSPVNGGSGERDYISISRFATVCRVVSEIFKVDVDGYAYAFSDKLVCITKFSDAIDTLYRVVERFECITLKKLDMTAVVNGFTKNNNTNAVYETAIAELENHKTSQDKMVVCHRGFNWDNFGDIDNINQHIQSDMNDDGTFVVPTGDIYKYVTLTQGIVDYCDGKAGAEALLAIPRFNKHITLKNNGKEAGELYNYIKENFDRIVEDGFDTLDIGFSVLPSLIKYNISKEEHGDER